MSEVRLVKYDAARNGLAEAHRVDEVKDIRDKALAMKAYAQQAKDDSLLVMATEIKARAEGRAGELLREMDKRLGAKGIGKKVQSPRNDATPSLRDLGISLNQSSAWQRIAAIPEERFETLIAQAAETGSRVTTKALVAEARKGTGGKGKQKREKPFLGPRVEDVVDPLFMVLSDLSKRTKERPAARAAGDCAG